MTDGLIGRKVGMTQDFEEKTGRVIPITVLEVGPCTILQVKTVDGDGYEAVQIGFDAVPEEKKAARKLGRPRLGHCRKAGGAGMRLLREFGRRGDEAVKVGQVITVEKVFAGGGKVDVRGVSKGSGFTGVMKRYGFHGGDASRGSMFHRTTGSIGASAYPSRVVKGKKLPGQRGNRNVSVLNLTVTRVDAERNMLFVRGAVPGPNGRYVEVRISRGETAVPEAPKPESKKPESTKPESTKPESTKPESTKRESKKPESTKPEGPKPESTKS